MISFATVIAACLLLVLVIMFIAACIYIRRMFCTVCRGLASLSFWPTTLLSDFQEVPDAPEQADESERLQKLSRRWNGEALVVLALPWMTLCLGLLWADLSQTNIPAVLSFVCLPQLLRVKAWELHDLHLIRKDAQPLGITDVLRGLPSCLDVLDAATDGLAVATCLTHIHHHAIQRFHTAWEDSVWPFGAMVAGLGPGLSTLCALAYASWVQLGAACFWGGQFKDDTFRIRVQTDSAIDLSGAGNLVKTIQAEREVFKEETQFAFKQLSTAVKGVAEACLQLLLQTSIIAANNGGLFSDRTLAVSVAISWLTLLGKWMDVLGGYRFLIFHLGMKDDYILAWLLYLCVVPSMGALLVYVAAKIYFIEHCKSHEWGMSTGCVTMS
mmetsp:Transcript_35210/g.64316  ORF Transcript_35210/g.64316 Transcript_35210/m.64316 type:complete len:384 (+) Transcript_35210:63-1214(+)